MVKQSRLGLIQKHTLFVLFALEKKNITGINIDRLLEVINLGRNKPIERRKYKISIEALVKRELISKRLLNGSELILQLKDLGRSIGKTIYTTESLEN